MDSDRLRAAHHRTIVEGGAALGSIVSQRCIAVSIAYARGKGWLVSAHLADLPKRDAMVQAEGVTLSDAIDALGMAFYRKPSPPAADPSQLPLPGVW